MIMEKCGFSEKISPLNLTLYEGSGNNRVYGVLAIAQRKVTAKESGNSLGNKYFK